MENSYVLRAILEAQDRSFSKAIANAIKSTNLLATALEQVEKDVTKFDAILNSSTNGLDDLANSSVDSSKSLEDIGDSASDASSALTDIADSSIDVTSGLSDVGSATSDVSSGLSDVANASNDTSNGLADVVDSSTDTVGGLSDIANSSSDAVGGLSDVANASNDTSNGLADVSNSSSDASSAVSALKAELDRAQAELQNMTSETDKSSDSVGKMGVSIGSIASGALIFKALEISISAVSGALDSAISRFDTLNQYPKTLENLGASAEDAEYGMSILADGIDGLPTKLDDVTSNAQQMFFVFKDAEYASQSTIALNNALLASGSSSAEAARGTQQYLKMLQTGKVDMVTWNSLQQTMGLGLEKVSEDMLGAGASSQQLYSELQSGRISIDEFNSSLVGMSDELNTIALDSTKGIGTSIQNMQTAITTGTANSIAAIDEFVKEAGINADGIAGVFDDMKNNISRSFDIVNSVLKLTTPLFSLLTKVVQGTTKALREHKPIVLGVATALATLKIANTASSWLDKLDKHTTLASKALNTYTGDVVKGTRETGDFSNILRNADGSTQKLQGSTSLLSTALALATGKIDVQTAKTILLTKAKIALHAVTSPLGLTMLALGSAAAIVAHQYVKNNAETKKLKKEQEELTKSISDAQEENDRVSKKIEKHTENLTSNASALESLIAKEKKSASVRNEILNNVDMLNSSIEGLNLAYDKEKDALNMSNDQIKKRIELNAQAEKGQKAQEKLPELYEKEKQAVDNLEKAQRKQQEAIDAYKEKYERIYGISLENIDNLTLTTKETKLLQQAEENRASLAKQIAEAEKETNEGLQAQREQLAQNQHIMIENQRIDYEKLSDTQRESFDNMKSEYESLSTTTTNVFEQIQQKSSVSMDEMIANLQANQEAMRQWSENIALLSKLGIEDGVIKQLEAMGPAGATQTQQLVDEMTDELGNLTPEGEKKMNELNEAMQGSVRETTEGMVRVLGEGSEPIVSEFEKIGKESTESFSKSFEGSELQELGQSIQKGVVEAIETAQEPAMQSAETTGEKVTEGISNGITSNDQSVGNAMDGILESPLAKIQNSIADFRTSGTEISKGVSLGINDGKSSVTKSSENLADDLNKELKAKLAINSPSKVMIENGKFITDGLARGISQGESNPLSKTRELASKIPRAFDGLPNTMYNIGVNSMNKLAEGISVGGQNAINEAQKVADSIAKIMDNANKSVSNIQNKARVQNQIEITPQMLNISENMADLVDSHIDIGARVFQLAQQTSHQPRDINVKVENQTDGKILQEFKHIKREFSRMVDTVRDMKIVLDTNVLVGQVDVGLGANINSERRHR